MRKHFTIGNALLLVGTFLSVSAAAAGSIGMENEAAASRRLVNGSVKAVTTRAGESGTQQAETRTILEEDFDKFTDGSISEPGAWVPADYDEKYMDYYRELGGFIPVPEELTDKPGWLCCGVRQAGGAVYAGDNRMGIGMLVTPSDDYYGKITIRFNAKTTSKKHKSGVMVFVGDDMQMAYLEPTEGEELKPYEVTFVRDSHEPTSVCIQIPTYSAGIGYILDDLQITATDDFALAPSNPLAMDFTDQGFTAWWQPSENAHHYLLDVWEETEQSDQGAEVKEDFSDAEVWEGMTCLPRGWNYDGADPTIVEDGYENSVGIVLDQGGQDLYWQGNGGRIIDFSIYLKAYSIAENRDEDAYPPMVSLTGWDGVDWNAIGSVSLTSIPESGGFINLKSCIGSNGDPTGRFTQFRVSVSYFAEGDKLLIDEAGFLTTPPAKTKLIKEQEVVEANKLVMTDLDPAKSEYYFRVYSVNDFGTISEPTQRMHALGVVTPTVLEASDIESRGAYTANWIPVNKAQVYTVQNYRSSKIAADEANHTIMAESFTDANGDGDIVNLGGQTFLNLDEYSDTKGWSAYHGCMANGMLGARGDYNELRSPELTLNNNDGKFTVKMTVYSYPGEILAVQSFDTYSTIEFEGEPDALGLVKAEREFTFTDGRAHHQMVFYTLYGDPFLIDDIEIKQDVKAGDRIMTLDSSEQTTESSYRFSGLQRSNDFDYSYSVKAHRVFYDGSAVSSEFSNDQIVLFPASINSAIDDSNIVIKAQEGSILVTLPEAAHIAVFNMDGRIITVMHGQSGVNAIPMNEKGVFGVSVNGKTAKVII